MAFGKAFQKKLKKNAKKVARTQGRIATTGGKIARVGGKIASTERLHLSPVLFALCFSPNRPGPQNFYMYWSRARSPGPSGRWCPQLGGALGGPEVSREGSGSYFGAILARFWVPGVPPGSAVESILLVMIV